MIWSLIGLAAALSVAAVAWRRSRRSGGFYDSGVYGMTPAAHRSYAIVSLLAAAYFAATCVLALSTAGIAGLALYAFIALFYATSFLRGASDE
jgi:uncharacterized membrane protein